MDSAPDSSPDTRRAPRLQRLLTTLAAVGGRRPTGGAPTPLQDDGHRRARDAARHYRYLYYSAPVALVSADRHGTLLRWNDRADAWFGDRLRKGRVNTLGMLLGEPQAARLLEAVALHGQHRSELRTGADPGPADRVFTVDASAVGDTVEISLSDVSDRSRVTDDLEHMAHHDALTELLNRRGLVRALGAVAAAAAASPVSLLHVDLDGFKAINEVFGHATGDAVLAEAAHRMQAALPEGAAFARLGGDEFVALLPGVDLDGAQPVATELLRRLSASPCLADGLALQVDANVGVVELAAPMAAREALALAEDACAQARRDGQGRLSALRADAATVDTLRDSVRLGSLLKTRLPVERLRLFAQPIVPIADRRRPVSFEVLLRTVGDDGRVGSPARLLQAAERHGGMPAIDRFVLERTLEHLAAHPTQAASVEFFAVNLGGPSLNDERFVRDAVAMLRAHPSIAPRICLEITEAVAVHDLRGARRFIDAFVETGATIALDDFGAGYTSFAYLKHLPASLLKIDGQFVVGCERDRRQRGIVQAIARLAHELDMRCLAEWVEAPETLRALLELDVDYAQGYLFAPARPIEAWFGQSLSFDALDDAPGVSSEAVRQPVRRAPHDAEAVR